MTFAAAGGTVAFGLTAISDMQSKRKKQILVLCITMCACGIAGTAWLASRVIGWASDLPNRISIQIDDDAANAFGNVIIESLHLGLKDSNPDMQRTTIQYFADWIAQEKTAIEWVRDEFSADLEIVSKSSEANVADAASSLLAALAEPEAKPLSE